jgi:glutamate-1-semialdehyde aminotransferase
MTGPNLYQRTKQLIPGGTQLLSKRPEMFAPDVWPAYYERAKGSRVWDLKGKEYIDMSIMSVGACILGYADDDVDNAVINAIRNGVASTLNCREEVDLAELLVSLHPWAQMVRYVRSGGEAMSVAVRIARASTQRDLVLFSGYHGWNDWYLAANLGDSNGLDGHLMPGLAPAGVPRGLKGSAMPFSVNDIASLRKQIQGREKEVAAIVIEPARGEDAPTDYLKELKALAEELGAVLIFDEITSAFRMNAGGIHLRYGVNPDIAVFAKCMANGYAMAAILGTEKIMQAAQTTFISSTNWTERIGPTAALATINKYIRCNAADHIIDIGNQTKQVWRDAAQKHGLKIKVSGLPTLANFSFDSEHNQTMQTFFTTEMLNHGFLGFRQFKPSLAHTAADVAQYATAVDQVFAQIASIEPHRLLSSPVAHAGFFRLTKE